MFAIMHPTAVQVAIETTALGFVSLSCGCAAALPQFRRHLGRLAFYGFTSGFCSLMGSLALTYVGLITSP